ncbi:MAG: DUF362 domain-containing protein [Deferrisomatales bacterium]|nr:DUF362 domain-containing protein [Deferrisomatales bacterium]
MAEVVWVDAEGMAFDNSVPQKVGRLLDAAGAAVGLEQGVRVTLKVNTAEEGYPYGLRPVFYRPAVALAESVSGKRVTLCDGLKLVDYWNGAKGQSFLEVARASGYATDTLGGNFAINGGYSGDEGDLFSVGLAASELGGVEVGTAVCRADTLWFLSHVTLHPLFGLSGALWNGGFECLVGRERTRVLAGVDPYPFNGVRPDRATLGGLWGRALEAHRAVRFAVSERVLYVNYLWDVTPQPEYFPFSAGPVVRNLGFLASRDPLALDAATWGVLEAERPGAVRQVTQIEFAEVLGEAEALGLGARGHTLRRLS